jgi:lipoprotein-anchoring transpeptidase ErfK/SrfK
LGIAGVVLIVLFLMTTIGVHAYYQETGRIIPGITINGIKLDNMTLTEAGIHIHKTWNLEHLISISDGIDSKQVSPAMLGLSVDPLATAQMAYEIGHSGFILDDVRQMFNSYLDGFKIIPVVTFDKDTARAGLEELAAEIGLPPKDASLYIDGAELIPIPGELGYTINVDETMALLENDPDGVMLNGSAQIILMPLIPGVNDVSGVITEAQQFLDAQVSILAYDPISNEHMDWEVERETIGSWLKFEPGDSGPQVALDESMVAEYLSELNISIGPDRYLDTNDLEFQLAQAVRQGDQISLIIKHKPTNYVVQRGDTMLKLGWRLGMPYWMILQANPGLDPENLITGTELIIPSKDELLPLPVIPNKRIVLSIKKQQLKVYEDGELLSKHPISTGIDRSPTQPGIFQVQTHQKNAYASVWDLYMPNFLGIYESWPGFMNGIHGLPRLSNGQRLWANILGSPASFGCIILDLKDAKWLYNWAEDGVIVEIEA